jgi:hypothetical protein
MRYLILALCLYSNMATAQEALAYLQQLDGLFNSISARNLDYFSHAVHASDPVLIEQKRIAMIAEVVNSHGQAIGMPPFNNNTSLRDEAAEVFKGYLQMYQVDFAELGRRQQESLGAYEALEAYYQALDAAERKLDRITDRYLRAYRIFAKNNNIQLIEAPEDMESDGARMNRVNGYYRSINRQFFKMQKRQSEFIEATNRQAYRDMETAYFNLQQEANRARYAFGQLTPFDGDDALRQAALQLAETYHSVAGREYVALANYFRRPTADGANAANAAIDTIKNRVHPTEEALAQALDAFLKKHTPRPTSRL